MTPKKLRPHNSGWPKTGTQIHTSEISGFHATAYSDYGPLEYDTGSTETSGELNSVLSQIINDVFGSEYMILM
jgi:hypothetical protein